MNHDRLCVRIILFSPQANMNPLYEALSEKLHYHLTFRKVHPQEALAEMAELPENAFDVILSRGFTYEHLYSKSPIPIVEIKTSPLDIVHTVLRNGHAHKHIVVFLNTREHAYEYIIEDILHRKIRFEYCNTKQELVSTLRNLQKEQKEWLIVGRQWSVEQAEALGMHAVLLEESDLSVRNALDEAIKIAHIRLYERQRFAHIEAIINTLESGVFVLDKHGVVVHLNKAAAAYINASPQSIIGQQGHAVIPESQVRYVLETGRSVRDHLTTSGETSVLWTIHPIISNGDQMGVLCQFAETRKVLESVGRVRKGMRGKCFTAQYTFNDIITQNPKVAALKKTAKIYAQSGSTVLITGESGTGKELLAQSIHLSSPCAKGPFVAVNCAAIPESLLESELFGYEEGAFTGARRHGKPGLFELAHGGTFFLDEVADMSPSAQARLLRVIQEKEIVRVGGAQVISMQVRLVCATNQPLQHMVQARLFRSDLYYRLNVLTLHLPPLRERPEDICAVALPLLMAQLGMPLDMHELESQLGPILCSYSWPGNFRELQSVMERFALMAAQTPKSSWQELLQTAISIDLQQPPLPDAGATAALSLKEAMGNVEAQIILERLAQCGHDIQRTASSLGMSRMTLWRKMQMYPF